MPLYSFICDACEHTFDKITSFDAAQELVCPICTSRVTRQVATGGSFKLEGGGWAKDGYK